MLVHIGQGDVATLAHNAWMRTIEDGIHTHDIHDPAHSTEKAGTSAFADAVIARLGAAPERLRPAAYPAISDPIRIEVATRAPQAKQLVGIDAFIEFRGTPDDLALRLEQHAGDLRLGMISNRGQKVYPGGAAETLCSDHWRCRFQSPEDDGPVTTEQTIALLARLATAGLPFVKTEGLFSFDGSPGYSVGQGQ
jgi:isocitrate dehydrogenase